MGVINYFFDSYAIIEMLKMSLTYEKYRDEKITITLLNLLEITYFLLLSHGEQTAMQIFSRFKEFVVDVPDEIIIETVKFRAEHKRKSLSYADCLGYCYAKHFKLLFLTGDDAFKGMPYVEFMK